MSHSLATFIDGVLLGGGSVLLLVALFVGLVVGISYEKSLGGLFLLVVAGVVVGGVAGAIVLSEAVSWASTRIAGYEVAQTWPRNAFGLLARPFIGLVGSAIGAIGTLATLAVVLPRCAGRRGR